MHRHSPEGRARQRNELPEEKKKVPVTDLIPVINCRSRLVY